MTTPKTDEDLKNAKAKNGPEIIGTDIDKDVVESLKATYPKARQIEKLASGNYAVRFRGKKRTVYKRWH